MTNKEKRISDVVNRSVRNRPSSSQEIQERLTAAARRAEESALDDPDEEEITPEADRLLLSSLGEAGEQPSPFTRESATPTALPRDTGRPPTFRDIEELRSRAADRRRATVSAQRALDEGKSLTAYDSTRSAKAAIDGTGAVTRIELSKAWRQKVRVEDFESVLMQAVAQANQKFLLDWSARFAEKTSVPALDQDDFTEDRVPATGGRHGLSIGEFEASDRLLVNLLEELEQHIDSMEKDADRNRNRQISGNNITLEVSDGTIKRIHAHPDWLARTPTQRIQGELNSLLSRLRRSNGSDGTNGRRTSIDEIIQSIYSV